MFPIITIKSTKYQAFNSILKKTAISRKYRITAKAHQCKTQSSYECWLDWNSTETEEHLVTAHGQMSSDSQTYEGFHIKYLDIRILFRSSFPAH